MHDQSGKIEMAKQFLDLVDLDITDHHWKQMVSKVHHNMAEFECRASGAAFLLTPLWLLEDR